MPYFSIIIPTLNEEKNIVTLLESLAKQTDHDFEVIVADCFSKDNTKTNAEEFSQKLTLTIYSEKLKNVSAARNFGASKAKGEFLIFFDADSYVEDNFIKGIKERINKHNLDMLTVWNRPKEKGFVGSLLLALMNFAMTIFQKIKPSANGPCIIIKKNLFQKIKGFDDSIVFGEDFEIIQRAAKQKVNFAVFPTPRFYVSIRRFQKEGFFLSLYKSGGALLHQLFLGPIRKSMFKYEMGGQYYQKPKEG